MAFQLSNQQGNQQSRLQHVRMLPLLFVLASLLLSAPTVDAFSGHVPSTIRWSSSLLSTPFAGVNKRTTTSLDMAVSPCFANEQGRELVERLGAVWEDAEDKKYAYASLQISESKERILDAAAAYIRETSEASTLAKKRWRIRFPSRRATVGCYGRILEEMKLGHIRMETASVDHKEDENDESMLEPDEKTRKHLNHLFELLSTYPRGVWGLEREMMQMTCLDHFGGQRK